MLPKNAYSSEDEFLAALRDWLAGQAMAAIIAKSPFQEFPKNWLPYEKTAIGAYNYADALLAQREEKL